MTKTPNNSGFRYSHTLHLAWILLTLGLKIQLSANPQLASEEYKKGHYGKAINLYEKSLDQDSHSSSIHYNIGNAAYKMQNYKKKRCKKKILWPRRR